MAVPFCISYQWWLGGRKGRGDIFINQPDFGRGRGGTVTQVFLPLHLLRPVFLSLGGLWCLRRWAPISRRATDKGSLSSLVDAMAVVVEEVHAMVVVEEDPATPVGVEAL